jgi:hypothetical protein
MNPDFPPIEFQAPLVRARRRERKGFELPPVLSSQERSEIAKRWRAQLQEIDSEVGKLSPEARRAIFLKLTHDRPLRKEDLAGTGLTFMSPPGEKESLVVPREPEQLQRLHERIEKFIEAEKVARPAGTDLATTVKSVEVGNPQERLSEELASIYDQLVQREHVIYEIEVASFAVQENRARREVEAIVAEIHTALARGVHGAVYDADFQGRGARLVVWSTGNRLREFVENEQWWRRIVFFDTRPKFETFSQVLDDFNIADLTLLAPQENAQNICVIDTGIASGNPFLEPVLQVDMSRSFIHGFSPIADAAGHGSGVASLASYYQLDISKGAENRATARVISARITDDDGQFDSEATPDQIAARERDARLLSNVLRDIVGHYKPLGVRIYVLSFQIVGHIWSQATRRTVARNAWVARTIDQLVREHDVIFVTITGNIPPSEITEFLNEAEYPGYLLRPLAKLHDPGQAALAVTVGSVAQAAKVVVAPLVPLARESEPSPFTRSGPGFDQSNKPDFVERGGNLVKDPASNIVTQNLGTNVLMASNRLTPPLQNHHGTSFAAPRIANHFGVTLGELLSIGINPSNSLLRALLAVSAERPLGSETLGADNDIAIVGYGIPDGARATDCSGNSVLLYWDGVLPSDATALFRAPVPAELRDAGRGKKRLVVSIAASPPVQRWGIQEYLGAQIKFRVFRGDEDLEEIQALLQRADEEENKAAGKHVNAEDLPGVLGISRRSTGTLQRDSFEWSNHNENYSANDYVIALSLKPASWMHDREIPVAVVVRIEDVTGKYQELYTQVRAKVQVPVRARI